MLWPDPASIPIAQCKDGHLYSVLARNGWLGVFDASVAGFVIRREKLGRVYPFVEYHWDTGEPHGTACPIEELELAPDFDWANPDTHFDDVLAYLESAESRCKGLWRHLDRVLERIEAGELSLRLFARAGDYQQFPDLWHRYQVLAAGPE